MRCDFTAQARLEIRQLWNRLAETQGMERASHIQRDIVDAVNRIADHPHIGHKLY